MQRKFVEAVDDATAALKLIDKLERELEDESKRASKEEEWSFLQKAESEGVLLAAMDLQKTALQIRGQAYLGLGKRTKAEDDHQAILKLTAEINASLRK